MTELRTIVTFNADFPNDQVEREGHVVRPAGRNIATVLSSLLEGEGFRFTEVTQHKFYGWIFSMKGGPDYFFLLQGGEPWILEFGYDGLLLQMKEKQRAILKLIDQVLRSDCRFSEITWNTRHAFEKGMTGFDHPE